LMSRIDVPWSSDWSFLNYLSVMWFYDFVVSIRY
jgi:hypothetical protein